MLNETIPGGATRDASGQWRDAEGRPLKAKQVAEAERIASEQQRRLEQIEAQTTARAMVADPGVISAFRALSLLQPQPQQQKPAESAEDEPVQQPQRRGREG